MDETSCCAQGARGRTSWGFHRHRRGDFCARRRKSSTGNIECPHCRRSGLRLDWQVTCSDLGRAASMKLSVIALDYDGTITRGDTLEPAVREAVGLARTNGIVILLVTGRILEELQRVAGPLHFVDGVIAENGAVTYFPASGHLST